MKKETKENIKKITDYLVKQYGEIQPQWEMTLSLLADNLDLYIECRKSITQNGIFDTENYKKNPLLTTCKDLQATIMKQIQHFGLSPYAISKIKKEESDDSDEFIEGLVNE